MKRILVASHVSEVYAPTYPLIRFLKKKFPQPICILHPFKEKFRWAYFLKDFLVTLFLSFLYIKKYDLFIGVNCLNCFPGILAKLASPNKMIVYYSADYSTQRFGNRFFDKLYIWLDRFCSQQADFNWSVSERIRDVRRGAGVPEEKNLLVPNGAHVGKIRQRCVEEIIPNSLVFVGHLTKTKGVHEIVAGFEKAVQEFPEITLYIIGSGPEEERLKNLVARTNLQGEVNFLGSMSNEAVLEQISKYAVGLSPYNLDDNYTYYCDPVKVKEYLAAGLPVIITDAVWVSALVEEHDCGCVVENLEQDLAAALKKILENKSMYSSYRSRAKNLGSNYDWDCIYEKTFKNMKEVLG